MPVNVVKTQRDEELWNKAKDIAAKNGQQENWPYIMGIYKKMTRYEKKASQVYLTASDYKEFFEKYAATAIKELGAKAIAKVKGVPGQFKTEYDFGHPKTFGGKLKDIATFGGYKRGRDALDYARYATRRGDINVADFTEETLRNRGIPEETIQKLTKIKNNSESLKKEYDVVRKDIQDYDNFKYKHSLDYDNMLPDELVREYNKKNKESFLKKEKNKSKQYADLSYDEIIGRLKQEKKKAKKEIDRKTDSIADRKKRVDKYLSEVRRARDNELAKSLGFYATPTVGLAYGGHSLYNKHKDE